MENQLKFRLDIQFFAEDPNDDDENVNENDIQEPQSEDGEKTDVPEEGQDGTDQPPRDRRHDTEMAKRRREAEKAAKEKAEKENQEKAKRLQQESYDQGRIAALGGVNPYTKKPIKTSYDLKLYDVMKELDEKGVTPTLEAVSEALSERESARIEAEEKAAKEAKEKDELTAKNIRELKEAYPEFDENWLKNTIESNEKYRKLLDLGMSPKDACEFLGMKPKTPTQTNAKTPSSVQSGDNSRGSKKIRDMSEEEYLKFKRETYGEDY